MNKLEYLQGKAILDCIESAFELQPSENILDSILKNGDDARVGSTICGFIQGVMFTEGLAKEALEAEYSLEDLIDFAKRVLDGATYDK